MAEIIRLNTLTNETVPNSECLKEIVKKTVEGMRDLLDTTLHFSGFKELTPEKWNRATSALRSMNEAVSLLEAITALDFDDVDTLPLLSPDAMFSTSATFGNRCYFQRNTIKEWVESGEESGDYRFDLDLDW